MNTPRRVAWTLGILTWVVVCLAVGYAIMGAAEPDPDPDPVVLSAPYQVIDTLTESMRPTAAVLSRYATELERRAARHCEVVDSGVPLPIVGGGVWCAGTDTQAAKARN